MKCLNYLLLLQLFFPVINCYSQADQLTQEQIIIQQCQRKPNLFRNPVQVLRFYEQFKYRLAWSKDSLALLHLLSPGNYADLYTDSIMQDMKMTDMAISFFSGIAYGNEAPTVGYSGLTYQPDCLDIPLLIAQSIDSGTFSLLSTSIENKSPEYIHLKKELSFYTTENEQRDNEKIAALTQAINTIGWLSCLRQEYGKVIVVNIPSATLKVFDRDSILLESLVIVGRKNSPTPTLTSLVTEIVLYPYWMVPHKIATRELLPLIKKNPAYLDHNNFQVLDKRGRITDPSSIDWNALSAGNFPYTLRQSTGCDNSLGLVKLNFYSPYSVYLHDTPWKILFGSPKRYFSHGCIRVEKARELARLLLPDAAAIDTLITDDPPQNHPPVYIPLPNKIPVVVLYNTAWPDSSGIVRFYDDVYKKIPRSRK